MATNHMYFHAITHVVPGRETFLQWCESHQVSVEVGYGILVLAGDAADAERLWHDPDPAEHTTILAIARELVSRLDGHEQPSSLYWDGITYESLPVLP